MSRTLYLTDDDNPRQGEIWTAVVCADTVRVGGREAVLVSFDPPIQRRSGASLRRALLVPRSRSGSIDELRFGHLAKPTSVFVYEISGDSDEVRPDLPETQVRVAIWGLVGETPDSLQHR